MLMVCLETPILYELELEMPSPFAEFLTRFIGSPDMSYIWLYYILLDEMSSIYDIFWELFSKKLALSGQVQAGQICGVDIDKRISSCNLVLLPETIDMLNSDGIYVDATLGGAGP